jgi:tetraacyldisaccharide 4'-kinase
LKDIKKHFKNLPENDRMILTTEKDAVRLEKFKADLADYPIYVLPVKHSFLFDGGAQFDKIVIDFVKSFKMN